MLIAATGGAYVRILHSNGPKYVRSPYCVGAPFADTFALA
jgi:hypothetical protein